MTELTPVIEMQHITKKFGSFAANDDINLKVQQGEIHALLGENGAGKSTLMNILTGLLQPTSGNILINGQPVTVDSPTKANQLGIGMVHQHFMLVDAFTVTENIVLGSEITRGLSLDTKTAVKRIQALSDQYGLAVDPTAKISDISVGQQQRVEILKTLYRGADILIFDEPTAVLTPQEIEELITIMHNLAKEGKSIILITHKLDEIKAAAGTVTVIRAGKSIDAFPVAGVSSQQLADLMVGREVSFKTEKQSAQPKETVLKLDNLTVKDARGVAAVKDLSLEVKSGEIVGIAGIDGNGQTELVQAITGLTPVQSGQVMLNQKDMTNKSPRKITESGVGHIPEDRLRFGMQTHMTLAENMMLQTYYQAPISHYGVINPEAEDKMANRLSQKFDVRASGIHIVAGSMSGGNQQKAVIARELDRDNDLIIAAQPTRGLDVGAIEYIHQCLIDQRDAGKAVLVVSFELDEILNLSDRIAVINNGKIVGIVDAQSTNKQELGLLMTGMNLDEVKATLNEPTGVNTL
ncbi:ABC transporter ATP-binding protein [Leuconostoc fallax]|uniref:ABC transporter ATP-binding protein n=1 Tax=Leuconostoc fallax TaxID=1251 RepID=UPI002091D05C|nr:ABC transporter ATP-binding protein [Leuconostoc fallax]MCO6184138.1 ABC transporter ATP-binding protein [Leuconostoc fallax]